MTHTDKAILLKLVCYSLVISVSGAAEGEYEKLHLLSDVRGEASNGSF
jgi:hypothetical protein